MDILNLVFWNNTVKDYLIFLGIFFGLFILFRVFRLIIIGKLEKIFEKTKNDFDDLFIKTVKGISKFFYWFLAFYFSVRFINTPELFSNILSKIFVLVVVYEITMLLGQVIDFGVEKVSSRKDQASQAAYFAIGKALKWTTWIAAVLFVLSNFGVDVSALATGLGIGGIAIAFALQGILKDLFSYFTILLDKPVRIGDYIEIDGRKGKVKDIGLKTTRLVAVDGQEIVVANDLITSSTLDNHGKAKDRRVNVQYGVSYDTDVKTLKKLKKEIIKIIEKFDEVEFHRCHLRNLSDSSMDYDIVYHIKTRDYNLYMDINEEINFKILTLFEKNGVEIPYPTQTIYTRKG